MARAAAALLAALSLGLCRPALAQEHDHGPPADHADAAAGALALPHGRLGSGTSWVPDSTPMYGNHFESGGFALMAHGNLFLGLNYQATPRGGTQLTAVGWLMAMIERRTGGGGALGARVMLAPDAFTLPGDGYPLLLQTGESWQGRPLFDRQHPHDLFMEAALVYRQPLSSRVGLVLYVAPAGEPALGPTAYPHRLSAMNDPMAPIGHHWQDSTHVSFGVLTAGLYARRVQIEGSWFNGREPDEIRTNFDLRVPDSFSGRLSVNADADTSVQVSYGFLASPEALEPEHSQHRVTASAAYHHALGHGGGLASLVAFGINVGHATGASVLVETNVGLDAHQSWFGRFELVTKSAEALMLAGVDPQRQFLLSNASLGYQYAIGPVAGWVVSPGARASVGLVPEELASSYGTRFPLSAMLYVQIRSAPTSAPRSSPPN